MNRPLIVGIAGALVVLAAILLTFFIDREPDRPLPPSSRSVDTLDRSAKESDRTEKVLGHAKSPHAFGRSSPKDFSNTANFSKPPRAAAALGTTSQSGPAEVRPSFDIVRVNPQGDTVIAGRAPPNLEVTVKHGDVVIGVVTSDKRGKWVLVPEKPLVAGRHELTVITTRSDGSEVQSGQNVVVVVPERGKDVAGAETTKPAGSLAIALPNTPDEAPVLLQNTNVDGNAVMSLDVIDYGQRGDDLLLSGRAEPGAEVRIYLDNKYIGRAVADNLGIWRLKPGTDIQPGLYRMRVDRVTEEGKTIARIELPFLRALPTGNIPNEAIAFVQPGNSLWRIARQVYGSGLRYTQIYEANRDQIRDPDLIYPGQIFLLPRTN